MTDEQPKVGFTPPTEKQLEYTRLLGEVEPFSWRSVTGEYRSPKLMEKGGEVRMFCGAGRWKESDEGVRVVPDTELELHQALALRQAHEMIRRDLTQHIAGLYEFRAETSRRIHELDDLIEIHLRG